MSINPDIKQESSLSKVLALYVILTVLFLVRITPAALSPMEFTNDRAFNLRITRSLLQTGSIPDNDHLASYPYGSRIRAILPTGMYYLAAAWHKTGDLFAEDPVCWRRRGTAQ